MIVSLAFAEAASAETPLINGALHTGTIATGGLDTWTFTAARNDDIAISIGDVGDDASFGPWIRLRGPDGAPLQDQYGNTSAQIETRAPLTGTYTVLASNAFPGQTSPARYTITLARTPGPYTVSPGDEGGNLANGSHAGTIPVGDLDAWSFEAAAGGNIAISIGDVANDGAFGPWIRLRGPDGAQLDGQYGNTSAQIERRAPLTGTYTVLVSNAFSDQKAPANYALTLSGASTLLAVRSILAIVGSTQGNGAFFRTALQLHNPRTIPLSGRLVFHSQNTSGSATDPSLAYTVAPLQTLAIADVLPAMGIASGLGSLDLMTTGDPVPIVAARISATAG